MMVVQLALGGLLLVADARFVVARPRPPRVAQRIAVRGADAHGRVGRVVVRVGAATETPAARGLFAGEASPRRQATLVRVPLFPGGNKIRDVFPERAPRDAGQRELALHHAGRAAEDQALLLRRLAAHVEELPVERIAEVSEIMSYSLLQRR